MKNFHLKELTLVNPKTKIGERASLRATHAQDVLQNLKVIPTFIDALKNISLAVGTTSRVGTLRGVFRQIENNLKRKRNGIL